MLFVFHFFPAAIEEQKWKEVHFQGNKTFKYFDVFFFWFNIDFSISHSNEWN